MGEDHVLRTGLYAFQTPDTLIPIYVIGTLLILKNALHWTDFRTLTALGTGPHLKDPRLREPGHYCQACFLGIVLLEMKKGAGQLAEPAPRTLGTISLQVHLHILSCRLALFESPW
jgi:hypothetical protein